MILLSAQGNIFAEKKGKFGAPPTMTGSHLDTQLSGGRYDGVLGICAGIEVLRVLHEQDIETNYPVGVVNWTK